MTLGASASLLLALAAGNLPAADKIDLERDTPVPATEQIPIQDFFRQPIFRSPVVNPAGTHVAAIVSSGLDSSVLVVYSLESGQLETLGTRDIDSDVDWTNWFGDDLIGFRISVHKGGGLMIGAAKIGALQAAHPVLQAVGSEVIAIPPGDRQRPLVNLYPNGYMTGRYGQVVSVNAALDSGKMLSLMALADGKNIDEAQESSLRHVVKRYPVLETPDGFQLGYFADKEGNLEFGVTSTDGVLALHHLVNDEWQHCPENLDEMTVYGTGDNPGEVVVLGPRADNKPRPLEVLNAATGEVKEILVQDKAYDGSAWLYRDPVSHVIVGAVYDRAGPAITWFSDVYRNLQKMVDAKFPGQIVRIIGNDEKGKGVLLSTWSDRQPPFYHWLDLEKRTVRDIRQSQPWLDAKRMQPMSAIKYKTRDGRQLDAYVVMPAGASKQNLPPMIVLTPWGRDSRFTWGFNAEAQFFASRGYAVLMPNHRGSTGTTWMFPTEDEFEFRKMSDDVAEATRAMVASGLVDGNRVAIMGTDFGGYLALSNAAFDPELYKAVIALSASSADWGKVIEDSKFNKYSDAFFTRIVHKLGDPKDGGAKWDALAPARHAASVRAAVLVAHGEYDSAAANSTVRDFTSAASGNRQPVQSEFYLNEAGGLRHLRNKVDLYSKIEDFLAKNLAR